MYPFSEFDLPEELLPAADDKRKRPCATALVLARRSPQSDIPAPTGAPSRTKILIVEMEESTR